MKKAYSPILIAVLVVFCSAVANVHLKPLPINKRTIDTLDLPYDKNEKPKLISKEFSFSEGPAVDKRGNIFFVDQPNDRIWEYDINGKLSLFMEHTLHSNGMYFDAKGNLISCADEQEQLVSISPDKKITVLIDDFAGKKLNGPNDVWVSPNGDIYITDPRYDRPWWTRKPEVTGEKVYLLKRGSKTPVVVADGLQKPNGIVGTPDGKYLFVSDISGGKTYKYTIDKGLLTNKHEFCAMGSDGMTLDAKGNVYLTGKGVTIFNSDGQKIGHIDIDEPWTANLCFGGKNRDELLITASKAVYVMKMKVRGVE